MLPEAAHQQTPDALRRATREHYNQYPLEFLPSGAIEQWNRFQPRPFLDFAASWLRPGQRVVDVGCGPGRALPFLERLGLEPTGCDLSETSLRLAARRARASRLVQADGLALPFAEAAFDAVICDGVLHHTPDPRRGLVELSRIARRGGTLYLAVYKRWRYYYYLYRWAGFFIRGAARFSLGRRLLDLTLVPIYFLVHAMKTRGQHSWTGCRNFFYDYFVTPQASFHTKRQVISWGQSAGLALASYDPYGESNCHVFVFQKQ